MGEKRRGRPPKVDPNRKKISMVQALQLIEENRSSRGLPGVSKGYLYNLISEGKLKSERLGKFVLLYEDEIRQKLCG
jgi:excisionase family DNA binding protein